MRTILFVVTAAAAFVVAGCGGSSKQDGASHTAPQSLTVVAHAHSIAAPGASSLTPGLVTLHIRDASSISHGIGVIRLDGKTTVEQATKIVGGDAIPDRLPFTLLGGVPELQPGGSWTATLHFAPGRYLLFDDGENQKGMRFTFTVRGQARPATAPKTVGAITMTDFAFGIHLPAHWNGTGIVKVPNVGKEIHELTFVRFGSAAEQRKWQRMLSKGWPQGPPPRDAHIVYAVGGTSPGQTAYVRLHLPAGKYLAICLFPDPHTGKPHTALGMMSTVTVH